MDNYEKASFQAVLIFCELIQTEPKLYDYSAATMRKVYFIYILYIVFYQFLTSPNAHILSHQTKIASDADLHFQFFQISLVIEPKGRCLEGHVAHQGKTSSSPILLIKICNSVKCKISTS